MSAEAHDIERPLMRNGGDAKNPGFGYSAQLMFQHPAKTLKWIEQCGCKKLGDFTVQVRMRCPASMSIIMPFSMRLS